MVVGNLIASLFVDVFKLILLRTIKNRLFYQTAPWLLVFACLLCCFGSAQAVEL